MVAEGLNIKFGERQKVFFVASLYALVIIIKFHQAKTLQRELQPVGQTQALDRITIGQSKQYNLRIEE